MGKWHYQAERPLFATTHYYVQREDGSLVASVSKTTKPHERAIILFAPEMYEILKRHVDDGTALRGADDLLAKIDAEGPI